MTSLQPPLDLINQKQMRELIPLTGNNETPINLFHSYICRHLGNLKCRLPVLQSTPAIQAQRRGFRVEKSNSPTLESTFPCLVIEAGLSKLFSQLRQMFYWTRRHLSKPLRAWYTLVQRLHHYAASQGRQGSFRLKSVKLRDANDLSDLNIYHHPNSNPPTVIAPIRNTYTGGQGVFTAFSALIDNLTGLGALYTSIGVLSTGVLTLYMQSYGWDLPVFMIRIVARVHQWYAEVFYTRFQLPQ